LVLSARGLPSLRVPCDVSPAAHEAVHLRKWPEVRVTRLDNGFEVASCKTQSEGTATVGIWIDAGSRYEDDSNNGVAHFLEHLTFKGSSTKTRSQIESFFEQSGGSLNAYTTREQTVYYVRTFVEHVPETFDILTDILRRPRLDSWDIKMERPVILQEMDEVTQNIDEVLMDNMHLVGFKDQGLGLTILGPEAMIMRNIDQPMIRNYISTHYTGHRAKLIAVGDIDHDHMVKIAEAQWGDAPTEPVKPDLGATFVPGHMVCANDMVKTPHLGVTFGVCPQDSGDAVVCQVMQNIIGCWDNQTHDISARQHIQSLYERFSVGDRALGELQSVQGFVTPYADTSLLGAYVIAQPNESAPERFVEFVPQVFRSLFQDVLGQATEEDVKRAKEAVKLSCLLALDGTTAVADELGKHMLAYGRWIPIEEMFGRIDAIQLSDVQDCYNKYVHRKGCVMVGVGSENLIPSQEQLESALWA